MQRRSINSTTVPAAGIKSFSNRVRKARRRRSSDMNDVKALVIVAVVTATLTGSLVWIGARLLRAVYSAPPLSPSPTGHENKRRYHRHLGQRNADDDYETLPWNPIYTVPEAMEILGDRSDEYARLRQGMDKALPVDEARSLARVAELTQHYPSIGTLPQGPHHSDSVREAYDIYNCPETPPAGYPFEWKLVDEVLAHWPVNEIDTVPKKIHQGLCIFDYQKDYDKAVSYRRAELPFVVVNDPDVARTVERWSIPGYLNQMLGKEVLHRAEHNTNSHFLYSQPTRRDRLRRQRRRRNRQVDDLENQEEKDIVVVSTVQYFYNWLG